MAERGFPQLSSGSFVTVGTFDGVHVGHREILRALASRAAQCSMPAAVVTFTPHPLAVVNPGAAPKLLTPGDERLAALAAAGAPEHVVVIPFTAALASLTAKQFVDMVVDRFAMRELVVGYDHGLGRGRQGDVTALTQLGTTRGFTVHVVEAKMDARGAAISSSAIRRAIAYGDLDAARAMLGRPYGLF